MNKSIAPFSALYYPPVFHRAPVPIPTDSPTPLTQSWTPEQDPNNPHSNPSDNFESSTGEYVIPTDGHYLLIVQLIPINGGSFLAQSSRRRHRVDYALRLTLPHDRFEPPDAIQSDYLDVGSVNFGQLVHLKQGTRIACLQMPGGTTGRDCIRLKVELAQRKRKRQQPERTRQQLKKRRKEKRKSSTLAAALRAEQKSQKPAQKPVHDINSSSLVPASTYFASTPVASSSARSNAFLSSNSNVFGETLMTGSGEPSHHINGVYSVNRNNVNTDVNLNTDVNVSNSNKRSACTQTNNENEDDDDDDDDDDGSSDDSDWDNGFESDSTADVLPHSNRNVDRLAKRFKASTTPGY